MAADVLSNLPQQKSAFVSSMKLLQNVIEGLLSDDLGMSFFHSAFSTLVVYLYKI